MTTIARSGNPARKPEILQRRVGDEIVVHEPSSASVHVLNAGALAIWELCDGRTPRQEITEAICKLSGVPPDVIGPDVERILTEFDAKGLLIWAS